MTDDSVSGYLARGWSVVALHGVTNDGRCTCGITDCPNPGKHPLYRNWQRIPIRELGVWQHIAARGQPTNLGLATGRHSGVFALDHDPKNVVDSAAVSALLDALPPAWSQRTGSGGRHWLFLMPADFEPTNSAGRLPKGLDIRGTGGQIVIAPSVTDKGPYLVMDPRDPMAAPAALLDLIRPAPYTPRAPTPAGPIADTRGAAYAAKARDAELADLRIEAATRNERAYKVACRLHELLNAEWLDYDETYDAYLSACEIASSNKREPFGQDEAHRVWQNAAHHVGNKAAELPEATMGGTRLDFPAARTDSGASTPGPNAPSSLPYFAEPGERPTSSATSTPTVDPSLNLPPDFWAARPVLQHIQLAAHARLVSADVALYSTLARLAALWPHQVRLDNGVKNDASANLFVAVVGPAGSGKTSGVGVAKKLLPRPPWLDRDAFADNRPLGTGEGIAEVYMGSKAVPKLDEHGVAIQDREGAKKLQTIRAQVRHNALMHADEGEALAKLLERSGATVAETLRRAWVGETLGQSNGRAETTRIIEEGEFSLGVIIGFQPETAQPLLADTANGTPQRFLWCWSIDPSLPDEDVADPGQLRGIWPAVRADGNEWMIGTVETDLRPVTYAPAIVDELKPIIRAAQQGRITLPKLDAHSPLMLTKIAALLAYLDCGRRNITESDWALAKLLYATSRRVQDEMMRYGAELGKAQADAKRSAYAAQEVQADLSKADAREEREQHARERVALSVTRKVQAAGALTPSAVRRLHNSRDRPYVTDGIALAAERGWLSGADGELTPGSTRV
jgi:hypothetical protein